MPTWPPNNNNQTSYSSPANKFGSTVGNNNNNNSSSSPSNNKFGNTINNNNNNSSSSPFGNRVSGGAANNNNNNSSSSSPAAALKKEEEEKKLKKEQEEREEAERKKKAEEEAAAAAEQQQQRQKEQEEEEHKRKQLEREQAQNNTNEGDSLSNQRNNNISDERATAVGGDDDDDENPNKIRGPPSNNSNQEGENQNQNQQQLSPQRLVDPDEQLQPGLRRLLQTIERFHPTFAAMLAGDFVVPWSKGKSGNLPPTPPAFDPLAQSSVKKALRLKGDAAMALHSIAITSSHTIMIVGSNGLIDRAYSLSEMRKITLVRANRTDPGVLIVELESTEPPYDRSTAYFVLLTGMESGDRAEMAVQNSFRGIPVEVTDKPPEVRMPDMHPLLRRLRVGTKENDDLIAERSAILDRIRKLQLQNIARSAVEKLCVDSVEEAPQQERERQAMLNLLVNYICGAEARSKGEYY